MSDLENAAAIAKERMQKSNPTVREAKAPGDRQRIPLSVPQRKLEVPEIPGYYCRWFRGTSARLGQALQAGFEYVRPDEVKLNNVSLGGDADKTGNTDMGDRVSVVEGGEIEGGQAVRLYLMKQKMEWYLEDKKVVQDRNDSVAHALTQSYQRGVVGGLAPGENQDDAANRYVNRNHTRLPDLFRKKKG